MITELVDELRSSPPFANVRVFKKISEHKFLTAIILVIIFAGGYFGYKNLVKREEEVRYILSAVEKGIIVVSVSGSGQVDTLDQIDIKPKVSGEVIDVKVKDNQEVKAGTLLVELDSRDAQKAVLDAQTNLADAQLTLKNLPGKTKESLDKTYKDSLDVLTNAFKDFPAVLKDLKPIFTKSNYSGTDRDIDYYLSLVRLYNLNSEILSFWQGETGEKYLEIEKRYKKLEKNYFGLNLNSPKEKIETGLSETLEFTQLFLDLTRQSANLVKKYQDTLVSENVTPPISTTITSNQYTQLTNFVSTLSAHKSSLSSMKDKLTDANEAFEKEDVDIQTQELLVKQKGFDLEDAQEKLAQHYIKSPFGGIITNLNVKAGDSISANTVLATFITKQKIAEISLNEVDVVKVKVGQKTTLTFDALPDITLTGKVIEIDTIGTVSQGVVSYGVKIALDTDDERIKPGMSVTADIITDTKQDVLVLPNSAVKSQAGAYYIELVEIPEEKKQEFLNNRSGVILPTQPSRQQIKIGVSNDSLTEILSGLKEGDVVVSSTIGSTQTTQTQGTQQFQIPGMGGQIRMR